MSEIKEVIKQLKSDINKRITLRIEYYQKEVGLTGINSREALRRILSFTHGGKGIRGGLFIFSSEVFGFMNRDTLLDIASSLEIVQSALLIHDDIMDNDITRRGSPAVFAQYMEDGKKKSFQQPENYGKSMGICAGDVGFFMALHIFSKALEFHPDKNKLIELLHIELLRVGLAQMDDVMFAASSRFPTSEEILQMYMYKTAHYTFSLPLALGGIISGQKKETVISMQKLGEFIGLLFQIKDDEIGIYSDEKTTGKPLGSDLRENKKTFMRTMLETKIDANERTRLQSFIGKSELHQSDMEFYRSLLDKYKINTYIERTMDDYTVKAKKIIETLPIDKQNKNLLHELIQYVITRRS